MSNIKESLKKAEELLKKGSVIITAVDISAGVLQEAQLYFESENQAVMDCVNKDDLVQNWPDTGVYALTQNGKFCEVTMFEGAEDMYFRTDGTKEEKDDLGPLPSIVFMESVEAISQLRF